MTSMLKLREKATMLGIEHIRELDRIALVRIIQQSEGRMACYCGECCDRRIRHRCPWRYECTASIVVHEESIRLSPFG